MRKYLTVLFTALLNLCVAVVLTTTAYAKEKKDYGPPDETTHWVFQPAFGPSDAGWSNGLVPWVNAVEKATKGTVQIELKPAGSLTSGSEAFGAAVAGVTDGYAGWATVYGGELPAGYLAYGMPMGAQNYKQAWQAMWGDPKYKIGKIVQKAAHDRNLHWAGWSDQGPNAMFTTFPVYKLEDLQGKKMRAGGPQAVFFQAMGGSPVSMDAGDIYTAIKLGTIEGTFWDTGGTDDMSFNEVVKYAIFPGWTPAQHQEIYINLDSWKALNQWQRDRIDGIFKQTYFKTSRMHAEKVDEAIETLKNSGVKIIHLPDEQVKKMRRESIQKVWPKFAAKSEATAKGVKIWKQFLKDKGIYQPASE